MDSTIHTVKEATNQPIAKYHIEKRLLGTVVECLQKAEVIKSLNGEYAKVKDKEAINEWKNIIGLLVLFLISVEMELLGKFDSKDKIVMVEYIAILVIYVGYAVVNVSKSRKVVKEFQTYADGILSKGNYEPFYVGERYTIKRYGNVNYMEWKLSVLKVAKRELGDCLLYKIDYPLMPREELPTGMNLAEYWVFYKDGEYFQVAVGEDMEEKTSYMVLPVISSPIKTGTRIIEQDMG